MPYIYINKQTDECRLFGSLPVLCRAFGLDYTKLQYRFRNDALKYETGQIKIVKADLERGGRK